MWNLVIFIIIKNNICIVEHILNILTILIEYAQFVVFEMLSFNIHNPVSLSATLYRSFVVIIYDNYILACGFNVSLYQYEMAYRRIPQIIALCFYHVFVTRILLDCP